MQHWAEGEGEDIFDKFEKSQGKECKHEYYREDCCHRTKEQCNFV